MLDIVGLKDEQMPKVHESYEKVGTLKRVLRVNLV